MLRFLHFACVDVLLYDNCFVWAAFKIDWFRLHKQIMGNFEILHNPSCLWWSMSVKTSASVLTLQVEYFQLWRVLLVFKPICLVFPGQWTEVSPALLPEQQAEAVPAWLQRCHGDRLGLGAEVRLAPPSPGAPEPGARQLSLWPLWWLRPQVRPQPPGPRWERHGRRPRGGYDEVCSVLENGERWRLVQ